MCICLEEGAGHAWNNTEANGKLPIHFYHEAYLFAVLFHVS